MKNLWGREPAVILGLVQAVIALVLSLGFTIPVATVGAILAVTAAILSLVTRTQVTPTSTIPPAPPA